MSQSLFWHSSTWTCSPEEYTYDSRNLINIVSQILDMRKSPKFFMKLWSEQISELALRTYVGQKELHQSFKLLAFLKTNEL